MIYIICQHRSGSTWLLNAIGNHDGVYAFPEELNFCLPFPYKKKSISWQLKNKTLDIKTLKKCRGSFWRQSEKYKYKPADVLKALEKAKLKKTNIIDTFLKEITKNSRNFNDNIVCKYPVHPFYWKSLLNKKNTIIILHRDIGDVLISKLNDYISTSLRNNNFFKWLVYKNLILFSFVIENIYLYKQKDNSSIVFIKYEELLNREKTSIEALNKIIFSDFNIDFLDVSGKSSSLKKSENLYMLSTFERAIIYLTRKFNALFFN